MSQTADGAWQIKPLPGITARDMVQAVNALEAEVAGGPQDEIAKALMELISVTSRPPTMDDFAAAAYPPTMAKALWDYPIDIVRAACQRWRMVPSAGNWWPTEQQLRAQCEELFKVRRGLLDQANSLLSTLSEHERQAAREKHSRSTFPSGRTQAYVDACMTAFGPAFVKSYLTHRTCDFTDTTIYAMGFTADRLAQRTSGLIAKHGVMVKACPETTRRIYAEEDARAGDLPAPKKKWRD